MTDEIKLTLSNLEKKLNTILSKLDEKNTDVAIGDWIPELSAIRMTGLSRSTLFRLRNENALTSSTLKNKKVFYRKSDLEKLLNKNEVRNK